MNRKELAEALGISAPMVTKLAKRGMPTDDVDAARRWRKRHLEATRMKGVRSDTRPNAPRRAAPPAQPPNRPPVGAAPPRLPVPSGLADLDWDAPDVELRIAQRLALLAEADFDAIAPELRIFMALIPRADRGRLVMPVAVWDKLLPPGLLELVAPGYDASTGTNPSAPVAPADRPTEESLNVIFEVQCGLLRFNPLPTGGAE